MSTLSGRQHRAALLAERAAVAVQYAELTGPRADVAVVAGLQQVADGLYQHPRNLDPSTGPRQRLVETVVWFGVWGAVAMAVLLAVPDPTRPFAIAGAITGGLLAGLLTVPLVGTIWDRYTVRALAAGGEGATVTDLIATLRGELTAIAATLEPDRRNSHVVIGQRIEYALYWLDVAEEATT